MQSTPPGNGCPPTHKGIVRIGQTDGNDVSLESNWFVQPQQCEIVLECSWVKLWMRGDDLNATLNVGVWLFVGADVVFAQTQ